MQSRRQAVTAVAAALALFAGGFTAPVHADELGHPFHTSPAGSKSYVELAGAGHFFPTTANPTVSRALVSWFKRFVSADARFAPFTCGFAGTAVSDFRTNAC